MSLLTCLPGFLLLLSGEFQFGITILPSLFKAFLICVRDEEAAEELGIY